MVSVTCLGQIQGSSSRRRSTGREEVSGRLRRDSEFKTSDGLWQRTSLDKL
jgi:hypothetical protein